MLPQPKHLSCPQPEHSSRPQPEHLPALLQGDDANVKAAQEALLGRAKANSDAQKGQYDHSAEDNKLGESLFQNGYVY